MTIRMGDGRVANLPAGLDAYAGYVDDGGDGVTWPEIQQLPATYHLSISIHGAPAMCADVETGALSSWKGYRVGYCAVSSVNRLIAAYGRPEKLWTAHYDPNFGAHICSPGCWPGLATVADGTQWTDHGGVWDESLLADNFFDFLPSPPTSPEDDMPYVLRHDTTPFQCVYVDCKAATYISDGPDLGDLDNAGVKTVNVGTTLFTSHCHNLGVAVPGI